MTKKTKKAPSITEIIGQSGFPLQKEIEKLLFSNKCDYYPHQVEVPLSVPPAYASSRFVAPSIDLALCYAEHPYRYPPKWSIDILLECKKAHEKDWYFFSKLSGSYYRASRFPISAAIKRGENDVPKITSIFYECNDPDSRISAPVCDNVLELGKEGKNDRAIVYETCGTLSVALMHFLNKAKESMDTVKISDNVTIVFPVLVTTAKLHIIDSQKLSVNLSSGLLNKSSVNINNVKWVLFDYPISPMLPGMSKQLHSLPDHSKELATKMGCLIVQADSLIDFLTRFNATHLLKIAEKFLEKNADQ